MIDPREWLAQRGLAKPGTRGRFSNAAKEALAQAERDGVVFIDRKAAANVVTTVTVGDDGERVEEKKQVNPFAPHPPATRTGILEFVGDDGKTIDVNAKEACNSCRYSFGWCKCAVPKFRYWKDSKVYSLSARVN